VIALQAHLEVDPRLDAQRLRLRGIEREPDAAPDLERVAHARLERPIKAQVTRGLLSLDRVLRRDDLLMALRAAVALDGKPTQRERNADDGLLHAHRVVRALDSLIADAR
jgi:hypothetical protein